MNNKNNNNKEYKKICCPNCNSLNIIKRGKRKTENRGLIQRYGCQNCNKRFVVDDGFFKMKNAPQKITLCLDLFYRGVSTRKVQEHLQAFYPKNSTHKSIYKWVIKYGEMIGDYTDTLHLQVGNEIQIDEIEFKRRLYHQKGLKGIEDNYFIDSIDTKTRFLTGSSFTNQREIKDLEIVTNKVKSKTDKQVRICTSDGLAGYIKAIQRAWGYNLKECRYNVYHNRVITGKDDETFNFPIERLHNTIRERTKIMRDFHGCIESAQAIMKGFEVFYNFIRKHQGINCCPYELAIPELKDKLNVNNKWLALIEMANHNN